MNMKAQWPLILFVIMMVVIVAGHRGIGADDSLPDVFVYEFPDVKPIKIYAGPVTFTHQAHRTEYGVSCIQCHHHLESNDQEVTETCADCHVEPGFVRGEEAERLSDEEKAEHYLNALHSVCIGCHKEKKLEDRTSTIPISCTRCHRREALQ